MVIHLLVGALVEGDGIGNAVIAQYQMLTDLGYSCDIYVMYSDEKLKNLTKPITQLKADKDDLIIDHIGGYSFYAYCVDKQPCRKVLCYHNITPPELVEGSMKNLCQKGLDQISRISGMYDFICGDSAFNLLSLRKLGEKRDGLVIPIPVEFPYNAVKKDNDSKQRFLFVGRYVENKKIEDLIIVFDYYHCNVNNNSELSIIGNPNVSPEYTSDLESLIKSSSSADSISLVGRVSDAMLWEYYASSDVYLCMSEHEGFCIPIVEAMHNRLIVFAFDSSAIGDTMGDAGVLLSSKDPKYVATLIDKVLKNAKLIEEIKEKEYSRSLFFSKDNVKMILSKAIKKWSSNNSVNPKKDYIKPRISFRLIISVITPQFFHPLLRRIKRTLFS